MKIDYASDLHIDFWISQVNPQHKKFGLNLSNFVDTILPKDHSTLGDVLVLAGDLSHYNQQTMFLLIELKKYYKNIIVTFGNHDLYMLSKNIIKKYKSSSENRIAELKEICESLDIHYLDGQVIDIDGVKIGGTGSWYNLPTNADLKTWNKVMNDSNYIYHGAPSTPIGMYQSSYTITNSNWDTQKFWLKEKAKLIEIAKQGCDVFITHVGLNYPPLEGINPKYIGDSNNIFYFTDNIELLKQSGCKVHIHGHTHDNLDYMVDGINIVCNPLGYPEDNTYCTVKQIEI